MCGCRGATSQPPSMRGRPANGSSGTSSSKGIRGRAADGPVAGRLLYTGRNSLLLRGPGSGRVYVLHPNAVIDADARDAERFLASALFEPFR